MGTKVDEMRRERFGGNKGWGEEKGLVGTKVDEKRRVWWEQRLMRREGFGGSKG